MKKKIILISCVILCFTGCFSNTSDNISENTEISASDTIYSEEISNINSYGNNLSDSIRNHVKSDFALIKNGAINKKRDDNIVLVKIKGDDLKGYIFQSIRKNKKEDMFFVSGMNFILEKDSKNNFLSSDFYLENLSDEIINDYIYSLALPESDYLNDPFLSDISIYESISQKKIYDLSIKKFTLNNSQRIFIVNSTNNLLLKKLSNPKKRWSEKSHLSLTSICASQLGLSENRIKNIEKAAYMPDVYQSGFENGYNQQWSHAYMLNSWGKHVYGDADDDFHDNLIGKNNEKHEGYNFKSADYFYQNNDQYNGDWYLGYALHYIEDAALTLHSSFPSFTSPDLLTKHFAFENWVNNNLFNGFFLLEKSLDDYYYYEINDLKKSIYYAAYTSSVWTSDLGQNIWNEYRKCNYPEKTGEGSEKLANLTKELLVNTSRYVKGTMLYILDHYNQWENTY